MNKIHQEREAIEEFVLKVSMEGLEYAIENYPPGEDAPEELKQVTRRCLEVLVETRGILESYMEKYNIEYY